MSFRDCPNCQTPLPKNASFCFRCGSAPSTSKQARTTNTNRQWFLGALLALCVLAYCVTTAERRLQMAAQQLASVEHPSFRIYTGAHLYDRLTGKYAGQVRQLKSESDQATGSSFEMVELRLPSGRSEWKARETINRFFTPGPPEEARLEKVNHKARPRLTTPRAQ